MVIRMLQEACRSARFHRQSDQSSQPLLQDLGEADAALTLPDQNPSYVRADITYDVHVISVSDMITSKDNFFAYFEKVNMDHYRKSDPNAGPVIPFGKAICRCGSTSRNPQRGTESASTPASGNPACMWSFRRPNATTCWGG